MAATITRVFHLFHPTGHIFELIKDDDKKMTLYSLNCNSGDRVARQVQNHLIVDCGLKFGINKMSKIKTFTDMIGNTVELYIVIVDSSNSVRTRVNVDGYVGKWVVAKSITHTPENRATEWISHLKVLNAWTILDYLNNGDEEYEQIIKNNKIVNPI